MSGCFWEKNEMPECMKCGCRGKSFFPAELVERSRIKRAAGRLRMADARYQKLSEETVKEVRSGVLGVEEQTEASELKKKADLAVEIAEIITARSKGQLDQVDTLVLVTKLLFGNLVNITAWE